VIAWTLLVAAAVWAAHGVAAKVAAGVLMAVAALGTQLSTREDSAYRPAATLVAIAAGLAVILLAPNGLGEIPVLVAVMAIPNAFPARVATALLITVTVLFGLAVWWVSDSFAGLLAGLAVPFLAQRAVQRREIVRERDRAQALLVELEIGRDARRRRPHCASAAGSPGKCMTCLRTAWPDSPYNCRRPGPLRRRRARRRMSSARSTGPPIWRGTESRRRGRRWGRFAIPSDSA
jgi:hypothetical protein